MYCAQLRDAFRKFGDSFGSSRYHPDSRTWSFNAADHIEEFRAAVEWSGADAELMVNQAFYDRPQPHSMHQALSQADSAVPQGHSQMGHDMQTQSPQPQHTYGSNPRFGMTSPAAQQSGSVVSQRTNKMGHDMQWQSTQSQLSYGSSHAFATMPAAGQQSGSAASHGDSQMGCDMQWQSPQSQYTYGSGALLGANQQSAHSSYTPRQLFEPHSQGRNNTVPSSPHYQGPNDLPGPSWNDTPQAPQSHASTPGARAASAPCPMPPQQPAWPEDDVDPGVWDAVSSGTFSSGSAMQPMERPAHGILSCGHFSNQQQQQQQFALSQMPERGAYPVNETTGRSQSIGGPSSAIAHTQQSAGLLQGPQLDHFAATQQQPFESPDPTGHSAACTPGPASSRLTQQTVYTSAGPRTIYSPAKRRQDGKAQGCQQMACIQDGAPGGSSQPSWQQMHCDMTPCSQASVQSSAGDWETSNPGHLLSQGPPTPFPVLMQAKHMQSGQGDSSWKGSRQAEAGWADAASQIAPGRSMPKQSQACPPGQQPFSPQPFLQPWQLQTHPAGQQPCSPQPSPQSMQHSRQQGVKRQHEASSQSMPEPAGPSNYQTWPQMGISSQVPPHKRALSGSHEASHALPHEMARISAPPGPAHAGVADVNGACYSQAGVVGNAQPSEPPRPHPDDILAEQLNDDIDAAALDLGEDWLQSWVQGMHLCLAACTFKLCRASFGWHPRKLQQTQRFPHAI